MCRKVSCSSTLPRVDLSECSKTGARPFPAITSGIQVGGNRRPPSRWCSRHCAIGTEHVTLDLSRGRISDRSISRLLIKLCRLAEDLWLIDLVHPCVRFDFFHGDRHRFLAVV